MTDDDRAPRGDTAPAVRGVRFGALLRSKREAANISLRKLAKHLGMSPTYLSFVERGIEAPLLYLQIKSAALLLGADEVELDLAANRDRAWVRLATVRSERHRDVAALLATHWWRLSERQLDAIERVVSEEERAGVAPAIGSHKHT